MATKSNKSSTSTKKTVTASQINANSPYKPATGSSKPVVASGTDKAKADAQKKLVDSGAKVQYGNVQVRQTKAQQNIAKTGYAGGTPTATPYTPSVGYLEQTGQIPSRYAGDDAKYGGHTNSDGEWVPANPLNQSVSALSGDIGAIESLSPLDQSLARESELYNQALSPIQIKYLSEQEKQSMYQDYLLSAQQQLNPIIQNYNSFLDTLKGQQKTDIRNIDLAQNQNTNNMFSNQFAQNEQLKQQLASKGMLGTGIAQDSLVRSQMSGNNDLMQAFISAQNQKADLNKQYGTQTFDINSKLAELSPESMAYKNLDEYKKAYLDAQVTAAENQQKTLVDMYGNLLNNNTSRVNNVNDNSAKVQMNNTDNQASMFNNANDNNTKLTMNQNDNSTSLANNQLDNASKVAIQQLQSGTELDIANLNNSAKFQIQQLISQTDLATTAMNNGTKIDISKMDNETKLKVQKIISDTSIYNNTMDNETGRLKIASDLQTNMAKIQVDYAKLDFDYTKLESDNNLKQEQLNLAASNAQTEKDKTQLTALAKQSDSYTKQLIELQKAGKADGSYGKKLVKKLTEIDGAINKILNSKSYKDGLKDTENSQADFRNADINSLIP